MSGLIPSKPYTFPPANNKIISSEVNADFDTLYQMFDPDLVGIYDLNIHDDAAINPTKIDGAAVVQTPSDVSASLEQLIVSAGQGYSALIFRAGHAAPTESVVRVQNSGGTDVAEIDYLGFLRFGNSNIYIGPSGSDLVFKDVTTGAQYRLTDMIASGSAADASETAKGLVEEATQAQTDAGTAAGETAARLFVNPAKLRARRYHSFASSSGGTDAYAITISPVITAYTDGDVFVFEADVANTGAATLNVSAVGAKTIKKYGNVDLVTGDIKAGSIVMVIYDADSDTMMLQTPTARPQVSQDGAEAYAASAAGSDAYAITLSPAPSAYATGMVVHMKADVANTGPATINVNSLGAKAILKAYNNPLRTGDIKANQIVTLKYDGTAFQLEPARNDVPVFFQQVPMDGAPGTEGIMGSTATADGSVLFLYLSATNELQRFARDENTGMYKLTHAVSTTAASPPGTVGMTVLGSYLYIFYDGGANMASYRFLAADLTGEQLMTVPTIAETGTGNTNQAYSDGTYIYFHTSTDNNTLYKFSVSGTTITTDSTSGVTGSDFDGQGGFVDEDNATVYMSGYSASNALVGKWTSILATGFTETPIPVYDFSDVNQTDVALVNIDATRLYVVRLVPVYDETTVIRGLITFIPFTKP